MPAGMVATISSHASRSSDASMRRFARLRKKPPMMPYHSLRKYTNRAMAVPTCRATRNAR